MITQIGCDSGEDDACHLGRSRDEHWFSVAQDFYGPIPLTQKVPNLNVNYGDCRPTRVNPQLECHVEVAFEDVPPPTSYITLPADLLVESMDELYVCADDNSAQVYGMLRSGAVVFANVTITSTTIGNIYIPRYTDTFVDSMDDHVFTTELVDGVITTGTVGMYFTIIRNGLINIPTVSSVINRVTTICDRRINIEFNLETYNMHDGEDDTYTEHDIHIDNCILFCIPGLGMYGAIWVLILILLVLAAVAACILLGPELGAAVTATAGGATGVLTGLSNSVKSAASSLATQPESGGFNANEIQKKYNGIAREYKDKANLYIEKAKKIISSVSEPKGD